MRALIAVVALVLASTPDVFACKCVEPSLGVAAARAKLAFVGTINEIVETKHCRPGARWCSSTFSYVVTVERVWKGSVSTATVTMEGGGGHGDCSTGRLGNVQGQRWLFLSNGAHAIRMCSGTRRATSAVMAAMTKRFGTPKT